MSYLTPLILGQRTVKGWLNPKHVVEWNDLYRRHLYTNEMPRLAVSGPVRHAKTWFWSWMGISTYLMNHPERRVLYVSHSALADEYGYKIRQTIDLYGMLFRGISLAPDTRGKTDFRTSAGGGLTCASSGMAISGFGYDWILADDLQKAQLELDSEMQRDKIWRWFYSDLINRLTPTGRICFIMARRHPLDVMGMLQEHSLLSDLPPDKRWNFIVYRAIQDDGTALWPSEWSLSKLQATERDYELAGQAYLFECLYQQRPDVSPAGLEWSGELFDNIEYDELPPGVEIKTKVCALDPSKGKNARTGDFAAMCHLLIDTTGIVWIDDSRLVRLPGPQLEDDFIAWLESHECDGAAVESDLDSGSFAEFVTRKLVEKNRLELANKIWNLPSQGLGDKSERIRRDLSQLLCQKKLKIRRMGHYKLGLSQFRNFSPHGKGHDDFPDCVSMGVRMAIKLVCGTTSGASPAYRR